MLSSFFSKDYGRILIWFTVLCVLATIPFWLAPIDVDVAGRYYDPDGQHRFPLKYQGFWYFIYKLIPVVSGLVLIGTLFSIAASYLKPQLTHLRRPALVVLLAFIIGPGILVNAVFKENYGRPRPSQLEQFGGQYPYVKPWQYGGYDNAKSFPSGHASVGFAFLIFWLLWRKKHPLLGKAAIGFTLILGGLAGAARIVGGGHFLSDVMWAAYMSTMPGFFLYYWLIDGKEDISQPGTDKQKVAAVVGLSALGVLAIGWALVSIPFERSEKQIFSFAEPAAITVKPYRAKVKVSFGSDVERPFITSDLEGYGFSPMVKWQATDEAVSPTHQKISLRTSGWYTELHQNATLHLPESYQGKVLIEVLPRSKK